MGDLDRCRRCGRKLRSQKSRDLGYGPICRLKIRRALPKGTSKAQLDKALDLIETGGIQQIEVGRRTNRVFQVVSSRGEDKYLVAAMVCTCPAGRAEKLCYHRVAIAIVTA